MCFIATPVVGTYRRAAYSSSNCAHIVFLFSVMTIMMDTIVVAAATATLIMIVMMPDDNGLRSKWEWALYGCARNTLLFCLF